MTEQTSRELTIAGETFSVSTPYTEGHSITVAEAKALNQVRAENIRNNMAAKVKAARGDAEEMPADAMAELVKAVKLYDKEYEFTLASVGGGRSSLSPTEREARKIAREQIVAALKARGQKVGDVDKDKLAAAVIQSSEREDIIKLAKKRLAEAEKIAENTLEGLDLAPAEAA